MLDLVNGDNRIYTVVKDLQSSYQVLFAGVAIDELTNEAPAGTLVVSLQATNNSAVDRAMRALVYIKVLGSGLFCLAGEPERIFPDLSTADQQLNLLLQVPGYRDFPLTVSIPKNSVFPLPANSPIKMQRLPVRVQGRVVGMTATPAPIAGALVLLLDEPHPPAPLKEHIVALRTPLYFPHAAGTTVNQRPLTPSGAATQLAASVTGRSQTIVLKDLTGLAANDVLLIGSAASGEYAVIDALPQDAPPRVILRNKLNYSFPAGTAVQQYLPGATTSSTTLSRAADAQDGVIFLPINLPSAPADLVEIVDAGVALAEYHALGALADANGYYRFEGFTRVQTVYMEASATGFAAMQEPTAWTIDYGQPVNNVDFRLLP